MVRHLPPWGLLMRVLPDGKSPVPHVLDGRVDPIAEGAELWAGKDQGMRCSMRASKKKLRIARRAKEKFGDKPENKKKKPRIATPNSPYFIVDDCAKYAKLMDERQKNLRTVCKSSNAERIAHDIIVASTCMGVTRQARWGNRFYDFWIHEKFCAVEIDGLEHRSSFDEMRDRYNYIRSGILVFRAKNFDERRVYDIMKMVNAARPLSYRKELLGIGSGDEPGCNDSMLDDPLGSAIAWERVRYILDPSRIGSKQPKFRMTDGSMFDVADLSSVI